MAASSENLECAICLNDFNQPKLISCFHTFCENCLDVHIKATQQQKRFKCPICRVEIDVPEGGVKEFQNNFYIDKKDKEHFCSKHKKKELSFFCRDCCKVVCGDCILVDHIPHTKVDIVDMETETKQQLQSMKEKLEDQSDLKQYFVELIDEKLSSITQFAETAKKDINDQVSKICAAAKRQGLDKNTTITKTCEKQMAKLCELKETIINESKSLKSGRECVDHGLDDNSAVPGLTMLPHIQTLVDSVKHVPNIPIIAHVNINKPAIDVVKLSEQLGEIQILKEAVFTARFNLKQLMDQPNITISSPTCILDDIKWHIAVLQELHFSTLGIFLCIDTANITCRVDFSLHLVSAAGRTVSPSFNAEAIVFGHKKTGVNTWGCNKIIPWKTFTDKESPYLDSKNNFSVQAEVRIINI